MLASGQQVFPLHCSDHGLSFFVFQPQHASLRLPGPIVSVVVRS